MTQGGLVSPMIFNVEFDSVVRQWISLTLEDVAVIQDIMVHLLGRSLGVFYTHDSILGSRDLEWIHGALNVLIGLLQWIMLKENVDNVVRGIWLD